MSGYGRLVFLLTGFILLGMAHDQVDDARAPEFFGSLLMINAGAMLVVAANELVFLFVGLELVSMPTYLLLYLSERNAATQEAATKYFFLSIFSSGLLLFGLAYLYGLMGVSNLKALAFLTQGVPYVPGATTAPIMGLPYTPHPILGLIALVFVMAGLGFRVAAVPFHFYAPDVYQGSPTVIAALLAWVPKGDRLRRDPPDPDGGLADRRSGQQPDAAGRGPVLDHRRGDHDPGQHRRPGSDQPEAAVRLFLDRARRLLDDRRNGRLPQRRPGDADLPEGVTPSELGSEAVLFYLVSYALMTLGAFAVIIGLSTPERPVETVDDLAGLAKTHPVLAVSMAICLFSLAGIPPLAGFIGKFNLFVAAFAASSGDDARMYQSLAVIGVVNSAIGAYYYLKIVVAMYYRDPTGAPLTPRLTWPTAAAIGTCTSLTLLLGIWAQPIYSASRASAVALAVHDPAIAIVASNENDRSSAEKRLQAEEEARREARARRGLRWAPPVRQTP